MLRGESELEWALDLDSWQRRGISAKGAAGAKFRGQDVHGRSSVRNGLGPQCDPHADTSQDGAHGLGFSPLMGLVSPGGRSSWLDVTLNHLVKKLFSGRVFLNPSDDAKEKVSVWR